ncbi:MAG: signal recognition particle-docking protein FtsY [Deltaproteobacteria bacterium]|nr:signal recognition particle-docking protein FtsY [Deltaproteobacteria bacterium]
MNAGALIFGAFGVVLVVLLILAARRLGRKGAERSFDSDQAGSEDDRELAAEAEEAARTGGDSDEESDEEAAPEEEEARPPRPTRDRAAEAKRLGQGLAKTRGGFVARLGQLFRGRPALDEQLLEQVEEVLFTADIGVQTSQSLMEGLRREASKKGLSTPDQIWDFLRARAEEMLTLRQVAPLDVGRGHPFVLLVVGVNGTGKTTTIGKLASRLRAEGRSVLLAAGDTFRAAAADQLEVWGKRTETPVVRGKEGADPASVIVEALKRAQAEQVDVLIADTAGRLHTKVDLMEELQKVRRAIAKHEEGAPHETFLVLDSTTGQNAIAQAKIFKDALDITGIVLTKLDGTAKGGVVLGISHELGLPVRFVGIGEKVEDLREFDAEAFADALFERSEEASET